MYIKSKIVSLALVSVAAGMFALSVNANELVATSSADAAKRGGSAGLALDFVSSGDATAFEFEVQVPKGAVVNTKNCVSDVPSSHVGACQFNEKKGIVVVMVYSNSNALLPSGVVPVGRLNFSGKYSGTAKVQNILVASAEAKKLEARISSLSDVK